MDSNDSGSYIALIYNMEEMEGLYVDELTEKVNNPSLEVETFSGPGVPEDLRSYVKDVGYPKIAILDSFNPDFSTEEVLEFLDGGDPDTKIIGIVAGEDKESKEFREYTDENIEGLYSYKEMVQKANKVIDKQ